MAPLITQTSEPIQVIHNDICYMCNCDVPPPRKNKKVSKKTKVNWIGCDNCEQWFHGDCVGVAEPTAETVYNCEFCS